MDLAGVMDVRSSIVKVFWLTLCRIFLNVEKSQLYLSFSLRLKVLNSGMNFKGSHLQGKFGFASI